MKKAISILVLALSVIGIMAAPVRAKTRRVVLVIAGNLSIRDFAGPRLDNISALIESGGLGLVNVRAGRSNDLVEQADPLGMEAACVSVGAGAMAVGGAETRRAGDALSFINGQSIEALYACRTGLDPGRAEVLHPEIARIRLANEAASYKAVPGALGSALHKAGYKTALIGSSDNAEYVRREAAAIAMDSDGKIDFGCTNSRYLNTTDDTAPFGIKSDVGAILREYERVKDECGFVVIDFGDTVRADLASLHCTPERARVIRHISVAGLDRFLGELRKKLDFSNDLLMVFAPSAMLESDLRGEKLTPLIVAGPGFERGVLTSPSTRRSGLVTINDIAPSVLSLLSVEPSGEMVGRSFGSEASGNALERILALNRSLSGQADRQPAMRIGSSVQTVTVTIISIVVMAGLSAWRRRLRFVALVPAALPLVMLYLPLIYTGGLAGAVFLTGILTAAAILFCAYIVRSLAMSYILLCGIMTASLLIDLLLGAPLGSSSIAGYSPVEGARYYGIGNELMGTLIGAAVACLGTMYINGLVPAKLRVFIASVILGAVFVFIGAPSLGTNLGGALASAPAIIVFLLVRRGWTPNPRGIMSICAAVALTLVGLLAVHTILSGGSQSHIGRFVDTASDGGLLEAASVMRRKLALNFMLLETSPWRWLSAATMFASIAVSSLRKRLWGVTAANEEKAVIWSLFTAVPAAFIFNDSGVVAAATCSVYLWMFLIIGELGEKQAKEGRV